MVSAGIALCFAAPLGTENMFWAFCSQFYFMILFSVLSLYFIFVKGNDQRYFHYSLLFSVFAFLSLASGALVSFVIFLISLFQIVFNIGKSKKRTYFTSIIFFCLFLFEIFSTTLPTKHERLHGSASSLLKVINLFLGWPLIDGMPFGFIIHIVNIFLIFFILFRKRDKLKDTNFQFFISLLFWINAQILLFAYARGNSNLPNRYLDIFFLLPIFSFFLFQSILENKNTLRLINIIFFLISLYFFHSIIHSGYLSRVRLSIERENMLTIVTTSRKKELREKNSSLEYLQKLPETALPYPDAVRLHHIIADPLFDKLMPFLFFRDKN